MNERISPNDCKHPRNIEIESGRGIGENWSERHSVFVCPDCGMFRIWQQKHGEVNSCEMDLTFWLVTEEQVRAAGQYRKGILLEEHQAKLAQLEQMSDAEYEAFRLENGLPDIRFGECGFDMPGKDSPR